MQKFFYLLFFTGYTALLLGQNKVQFGLQTGVTFSTFETEVTISNAVNATVPPINEFSYTSNFQFGAWLEKRMTPFLSIRWEIQRSPGGAKAFDALDNREKRYKYFYLSSPLVLKLTSFQQKWKHPIQLEVGASANLFLFDYGEDVVFGPINQLEYSYLLGLTKNIDAKWTISLRYSKGLRPFSTYDANGVQVNWVNQMYTLTFGRSLFSVGKNKNKK